MEYSLKRNFHHVDNLDLSLSRHHRLQCHYVCASFSRESEREFLEDFHLELAYEVQASEVEQVDDLVMDWVVHLENRTASSQEF